MGEENGTRMINHVPLRGRLSDFSADTKTVRRFSSHIKTQVRRRGLYGDIFIINLSFSSSGEPSPSPGPRWKERQESGGPPGLTYPERSPAIAKCLTPFRLAVRGPAGERIQGGVSQRESLALKPDLRVTPQKGRAPGLIPLPLRLSMGALTVKWFLVRVALHTSVSALSYFAPWLEKWFLSFWVSGWVNVCVSWGEPSSQPADFMHDKLTRHSDEHRNYFSPTESFFFFRRVKWRCTSRE